MTSPWQVLGVPPGCSVDEIRRAYAKLLRQNRPDVDPVGFRRLRDAYEWALRLAEARASGVQWDEEEDEVTEQVGEAAAAAEPACFAPRATPRADPVAARPRPLAAPLRAALARARARKRQGTEAKLFAILARELRTANDPDLAELVLDELASPESQLRKHLQPTSVQGMASAGGTSLVQALLVAHVVAEDWHSLWAAVRTIETTPGAPGDFAGLTAAGEALQVVALFEPETAERLADLAFRRAPPDARHLLGEIDQWIQAGKQLRVRASWEDKRQLVLALCDPKVEVEDPVAKRAIAIALDASRAPVLGSLLALRFPTAAEKIERTIAGNARRAGTARRRRGAPAGEQTTWQRIVFFVILMCCTGGLRLCRNEMRTPPQPRESQERVFEAMQRARNAKQRNETMPRAPDDAAKSPSERR